jgi:hypothetical protein
MKYTPLIAAALLATACSKHVPPTKVVEGASQHQSQHAGLRIGNEPVYSLTGGQVIIPIENQHVLTVNPYPPVRYARSYAISQSRQDSKGSASKSGVTNPASVWEKLCAGKKLTEKERDILDEHPLIWSNKKPCNPIWNGEK